ncbi:MAG TPA: dephospho-CoA kinase [Patescibacteria group bacterium]|nr:dephospho-CoA kinase [Patescibacteria group bacterium]
MSARAGKKRKLVIGITGSFGSGKTTVAGVFRAAGARVIDADRIAHGLLRPGTPTYARVLRVFGARLLQKDRQIDRGALAGIVFGNKALLRRLNGIIHPEVIRRIRKEIKESRRREIVLDVPLLIEAGAASLVDAVVVVCASRKLQVARLTKKTGLSRADILRRIRAQMPLANKVRMADFVIDNNGSINQTKKQVYAIRRKLWKSSI